MKNKINEWELRLDYIDSPLLYLVELNSAGQRHGMSFIMNFTNYCTITSKSPSVTVE